MMAKEFLSVLENISNEEPLVANMYIEVAGSSIKSSLV